MPALRPATGAPIRRPAVGSTASPGAARRSVTGHRTLAGNRQLTNRAGIESALPRSACCEPARSAWSRRSGWSRSCWPFSATVRPAPRWRWPASAGPQPPRSSTSAAELSFAELDERSTGWPIALRDARLRRRRQHRHPVPQPPGLFEALFAAAKLGARTVLLNTDFGRPAAGRCLRAGGDQPADPRRGVQRRGGRRPADVIGACWPGPTSRPTNSIEALIARSRRIRPDGRCARPKCTPADRPADQRHHRHPEGRGPRVRRLAGHPGRLPVQDRAAVAGDCATSRCRSSTPGGCCRR